MLRILYLLFEISLGSEQLQIIVFYIKHWKMRKMDVNEKGSIHFLYIPVY